MAFYIVGCEADARATPVVLVDQFTGLTDPSQKLRPPVWLQVRWSTPVA